MRDLQSLRFLVELRRLGTLASVAESFSYAPSAVSQQLARLGQEFGVALLLPEGRRVKLTPQGEVLADQAESIFSAWEAAQTAVKTTVGAVSGTLRLAAFQTASLVLVPPLLLSLRDRHPLLRVEFRQAEPDDLLTSLVNREIDYAITESFLHHSLPLAAAVTHEPLFDDVMHLVTERGAASVELADLAGSDFVLEGKGVPVHGWALNMCRSAGFEPRVVHETRDLVVQHELIRQGLAVGFFPAMVPPGLDEEISRFALPGSPKRTIHAAFRVEESNSPTTAALTTELRRAHATYRRAVRNPESGSAARQ
jgi:DNA-binding transcriptional LysR family regulator